jgi:hypothetical protein
VRARCGVTTPSLCEETGLTFLLYGEPSVVRESVYIKIAI